MKPLSKETKDMLVEEFEIRRFIHGMSANEVADAIVELKENVGSHEESVSVRHDQSLGKWVGMKGFSLWEMTIHNSYELLIAEEYGKLSSLVKLGKTPKHITYIPNTELSEIRSLLWKKDKSEKAIKLHDALINKKED